MKTPKIILCFLITISLTGCDAMDILRSAWDADALARYTAQYSIMKPQLKNPESAKFKNMKIRFKDSSERKVDGVIVKVKRYIISFDLTAENSFGGRATEGYCLALSMLPDERYIVDVNPQKCERENPRPDEIDIIKALASYK